MNDGRSGIIDNLRFISLVAVIVIHISATAIYLYGKIDISSWLVAHFFDSLSRFCVPIFIMISGILLLNKVDGIKDFFIKRLRKIVLPFIFYSFLHILFSYFILDSSNLPFNILLFIKFVSKMLLTGSSFHFWYVYMIFGLYLMVPILSRWLQVVETKYIEYYLIVWFFAQVLQYSSRYYINAIDLSIFNNYIGYFILGYYLYYREQSKIFELKYCIYYMFLGFGITFFGTWSKTVVSGSFSDEFYLYCSPNIIIFSTGMLIFFKKYRIFHNCHKLVKSISDRSYGIYLIHILILILLGNFNIDYNFIHPVLGIPLVTIVCLTISFVLVLLISKLPFGKYISG